jgi:FG-GAP repeat protein
MFISAISTIRRITYLCPALLLSAASVSAQAAGGRAETLYQWDGAAAGDRLGGSVSGAGDVNGDGFSDVIVGAENTDPGGLSQAGSAFVYSGVDGSLLHQFSGTTANERFGQTVSGAGDVNGDGFDDLIISTVYSSPGGIANAGSAFVYSGKDGSLLHRWNGTTVDEYFATSVSNAGDVNGDGFDDLLIGNSWANPAGLFQAGTVLCYSGADGSLLHQWNGSAAGDWFGRAVSAAEDVNGDGYDDVIIGALRADPGGLVDAGSAYVYSGADGTLLYQWDGAAIGDIFGYALSGAGNVNADGIPDLIISATGVDFGGTGRQGSVFVFSGADGSLLHRWNGGFAKDRLGVSVSGAGDVNRDGFDDVIVGAGRDVGGLENAGSVYVYSGLDGSRLFLKDGTETDGYFGSSVSNAGDVNRDDFDDVVVGARWNHLPGLPDAGSAFVYGFNPFLLADTSTISASAGGVLNLEMDFPNLARFDEYKVLVSESGTGPSYYGVAIPLTRDRLVTNSFFGNYPVTVHTDLHGVLDALGKASASLTVPAGLSSSLIGTSFYLAAIANKPGQLPEYSSAAVTITITP